MGNTISSSSSPRARSERPSGAVDAEHHTSEQTNTSSGGNERAESGHDKQHGGEEYGVEVASPSPVSGRSPLMYSPQVQTMPILPGQVSK